MDCGSWTPAILTWLGLACQLVALGACCVLYGRTRRLYQTVAGDRDGERA